MTKCDAMHIVQCSIYEHFNQLNSYYYVNDKCNEIDFILRQIYVFYTSTQHIYHLEINLSASIIV